MINIDTRSREPIYLQIEKQIIKLINLGVYEANSSLPSVRAMACELGINPNTVAKAYKSLEQQNVIYTVVGKGVFVSATHNDKIKVIATEQLKKSVHDAKSSGVSKMEMFEIIDNVWGDKND